MQRQSAWRDRRPVIVGSLALFLLVGGLGGWSTQVTIAGAVVGKGHIEVDTSKQTIAHPLGGVVADLLVRDGDAVEAGDVVLRLDDVEMRTRLNTVEGELFEETILAWDEPRRWTYRIDRCTAPLAHAQVESTELAAAGDGTRVRWILASDPREGLAGARDVLPHILERRLGDALANLERLLS